MDPLSRRAFIGRSVAALGAASGLPAALARAESAGAVATRPSSQEAESSVARRPRAHDTVVLGKTGIRPSRLSMGTGTRSGSEQRALGVDGFVKLLHYGLDQGICWWDAADMYKTHPHLRAALKEIRRDRVVITSKTSAKDAAGVRADIERFRKELDSDYIDIVLLHCMTDGKWPEKMRGAMDALSEAKEKQHVRAVGCSCHTFEALQAAADEPWVEVDLARINPFGKIMDVNKAEDVPRVIEVLETMYRRGKAIYGMKILGEGAFKGEQIDRSLQFVLSKPFVSGFTIGFSSREQIDDIVRRIERVAVA
ncbi:MAG TPA: aldo/keto reductase [Phycisphaerae bacterium]|nr:aldo/keto reductase [Phycisphaerae bacterium]HOM51901.1 aldo/keto reductase [Phycisphaerae bacterium]HON67740.1 aldo/keto reductase [Phycisphaerae bacterium]HOQ84917.1 aldo/keto reductase [Phycisphaerae bacterium]HPP28060.1 aldo/keto reductase [Phycisphaerae bacterium]